MFKIESYVTPILLSYVDKYVRDFKPADAQVSLWGGGVALHNLVLKADVLQQEVSLPFTLVSGRIHELLIQVPWTKIMSEPIVVTIDTIECVLSLNSPTAGTSDDTATPETPGRKSQVVEAPPGYMQALVRRIVSNIALRVHHLIVKYVQDDIVLSLNVKHLAVDSAGPNWESAFADIDQAQPVIRRLMRLEDLTLCLDRADADGKIRFYQEPLLYRCQLDFRILTRLISANTRRATCLSIQLRSTKLAWGVTSDQLTLLLRLARERGMPVKPPTPAPKSSTIATPSLHVASSNSAEPARSESWSEWAWSWLPSYTDREGGTSEAPQAPSAIPIHFAAYFDDVNFVYKTLEMDGSIRKRARGILELNASRTAFKSSICNPTTIHIRCGMRELTLLSRGKCVCGFLDYNGIQGETTTYLCKRNTEEPAEEEWQWPDDPFNQAIETTIVPEEVSRIMQTEMQEPVEPMHDAVHASVSDKGQNDDDDKNDFWTKMAPQLSVEYIHERSPPAVSDNPYDNPPHDFQYSDWVEECETKILVEPMDIRVCMGLLHRLTTIANIIKDLPPTHAADLPMRTLTVEECEALSENLPQRRIFIEAEDLHIQVYPWDHSTLERASAAPLLLDIDLPKNTISINGPLYPHRVCSAACQMPEEGTGALWQGCRLHITVNVNSAQAKICSSKDGQGRPCARMDLKAVGHLLLHQGYFNQRKNVMFSYSIRIKETNLCGSAARLKAAFEIITSLHLKHLSTTLKYSTLANDALNDEEAVAIDLTFEDFTGRGYFTKRTNTHILSLQSTKATALHEKENSTPLQSWLLSSPDAPSNTPCLRIAVQWCYVPEADSLDYVGIWTEPSCFALDPLFIVWLAYKPILKRPETTTSINSLKFISSQYVRHRTPPASSSGRGATRSGSGAEVHGRARSLGSSDKGENNMKLEHQQEKTRKSIFENFDVVALHERLRKMLVNIECGLAVLYVTMSTASALDCATIRDAMDRHANMSHRVIAISLGRLSVTSSSTNRQLWQEVKHDGPTFLLPNKEGNIETLPESFPWKMRLADVGCQTLELYGIVPTTPLRSQLKSPGIASRHTILEPFTTTVTLSVVTKSVQIKYLKHEKDVKKDKDSSTSEPRVQYFKSGMDFKPTTLKEFVRGPASRKKEKQPEPVAKESSVKEIITDGPVVSLGIHLHADTPPLSIKLEKKQVQLISATLHCFAHIVTLLKRPPLLLPKPTPASLASAIPLRSNIRSVSELDEQNTGSDETPSETRYELIPIYEPPTRDVPKFSIKTFFWFQWVVSRISLVATTANVKLAFDIDDMISTIDLQMHYNQLKVKVASFSVRHYFKSSDEWAAGALKGRVLEAREPTNAQEENHFLAVTITQARISNLPTSWKEELHPKLLEQRANVDSMWEIYATLAPLEVVIQPSVLEHITSLLLDMAPRELCPMQQEKKTTRTRDWQWPFCYVTAGGIRLLLSVNEEDTKTDDTFMFVIGHMTMNPYPENPICRRTISSCNETGWSSPQGNEGCQYEILATKVAVRCAQFKQLVNEEASATEMSGTASENPALKWTQEVVHPVITPVLHSMDISCVLAPALFVNDVVTCGPAVELNLLSDCAVELSLGQLIMAQKIIHSINTVIKESEDQIKPYMDEEYRLCTYAELINPEAEEFLSDCSTSTLVYGENSKTPSEILRSGTIDSGVETVTSSATRLTEPIVGKKPVSVAFMDRIPEASEHLEVFVTMGMIQLSLYVIDDGSPDLVNLRPPQKWIKVVPPTEPALTLVIRDMRESDEESSGTTPEAKSSVKSITEDVRDVDIGHSKLGLGMEFPQARKTVGNLPLLHATFQQPNLYYWRKKTQMQVQFSMFNMWLGLGAGEKDDMWHSVLLSTSRGVTDPITGIPPALATAKVVMPSVVAPCTSGVAVHGTIRLDVERPVMLELSEDRLLRLINIATLVKNRCILPDDDDDNPTFNMKSAKQPPLFRLRKLLVNHGIESVTVATTQVCFSGPQGAAGWDSLALQLAAGGRPERLMSHALISAAVISTGQPGDQRHIVLHPVMFGIELEANWEAWRRAEYGIYFREPTVRMCLDLDCITMDLRPRDLKVVEVLTDTLKKVLRSLPESVNEIYIEENNMPPFDQTSPDNNQEHRYSIASIIDPTDEHFYKDDLRSGAFKIVSGGQLPMAYQVTLHNNVVSWRYPHPRAVTRLMVFPLPDQNEETKCVLELYNSLLARWETYTHFSIPVVEQRELQLYVPAPDAVHALMWRIRVFEGDDIIPPFEFNIKKFLPRSDPLVCEACADPPISKPACGVTAEQLSGVIRVDSCFSPRLLPRMRVVVQVAQLSFNLHNELPNLSKQSTPLEGYYVSKPLWRAHRVLSLRARDATLHAQFASPAGAMVLLNTSLASDIMDCATGTMQQFIEEFRLRGGLSLPAGAMSRARLSLSRVHVVLHVPRLRTLQSLAGDWLAAFDLHIRKTVDEEDLEKLSMLELDDSLDHTVEALEGRVSLWIHNTCAISMRVGQEGTKELVPLGPGVRLAYRWQSPTAPKKVRFAVAGPGTDWHWSNSIPFIEENYRVRLPDVEEIGNLKIRGGGVFLHTRVEDFGSRKCLTLAGRLCLHNMCRHKLLYKVRARCLETNQWRTISSGELLSETMGRSVICGADCEMALKIKVSSKDVGWTGDIPLKECPKENVPWLVKVPMEGEIPYMSVWCRVVRARSDGRILAALWPLYVLYSHLPLDTDVLIETEKTTTFEEGGGSPLVQAASGRGRCTHLLAPGTTAARHNLSFQYRKIDCPVTKEAVPLHYGVTDTSVFDRRPPVQTLDEIIADTKNWLNRSGRSAKSQWPYSVVAKHWPGEWGPAMLQPRCDVIVRYQAVHAGGGCSLEMQLCPVVLLCNAVPIALTLRAHDAAPLCKLEPGTAITPPSAVLKKPFFISVEMGRETFVSGELSVCGSELGRYGSPPPGRVALDRATELAVQCNHKVALLSMFYEIKEEINILGLTTTYMLINRLNSVLMVSAMAVPSEADEDLLLRPNYFKAVDPVAKDSVDGLPLCRFWMVGNVWRGSDPKDLRLYLCMTLPPGDETSRPTPVRIGQPPVRRALALADADGNSIPVVVTQVKQEGRWVVTVDQDPCPQLLVHNRTSAAIAIAQPTRTDDEPTTSRTIALHDCAGTRWYCLVGAGMFMHYSTPHHCLRFPAAAAAPPQPTVTFLTFAKRGAEEGEPEWCAPVACADGEQLIQLAGDETIKMRVRSHPHSTMLELRDVDQTDISASEIRKRLLETESEVLSKNKNLEDIQLARENAHERLMEEPEERPSASRYELAIPVSEHCNLIQDSTKNLEKKSKISSIGYAQSKTSQVKYSTEPSTLLLFSSQETVNEAEGIRSDNIINTDSNESTVIQQVADNDWDEMSYWAACDRLRLVASVVEVELASVADTRALIALHLDRAAVVLRSDTRRSKTIISIADVQIDNPQYESGQYDFAVVATTRGSGQPEHHWSPLWNIFADRGMFATRETSARAVIKFTHDAWTISRYKYNELTEVEVRLGPLALYVEDAYVTSLATLFRAASGGLHEPPAPAPARAPLAEARMLRSPLRLRALTVHPLDLTLTLHTAVRMYIALDQSPLRLSAFKLQNVMTSTERLTHALTVHYLSAAILGAGWVVGGLELLGAPGALAARVGGATGGVRAVASAAAAALLRSLSAWAGSLARNLDLLAGDEEHARRAAAARRRAPRNLLAGLTTGITNFAINILGAVGGLAHHPLVGVAVGETDSGAAGLRRGLLGALAKPLSATADLVAYAGHGLLTQTGWDPVPQPRVRGAIESEWASGWRRDCVRWTFRLAELPTHAGFQVLMNGAPLQLLFTHKYLVIADPDSEHIMEMIDFKYCFMGSYQGPIIELEVVQKRNTKVHDNRNSNDEENEKQLSATAMARVARYTGADATATSSEARVLSLLPAPGQSFALHAALVVSAHHNSDAHFSLL